MKPGVHRYPRLPQQRRLASMGMTSLVAVD